MVINYISKGKVIIIRLKAGQIKKISSYKMSYYPDPNNYSRDKIKVELDFSNHATKSNLASLKFEVDKLDVDKLATAPID